ncbi:Helicase conserved C-terminal domain-containing protein [Microlunatus sagamiharensis]|uniref:Helicase conserved C-terminal domain-containing protein n=1 Tax=Microlunatus sagamiharensis TaxID=546874 RepID=A0A1H2LGK7_9ACTN|nr:helicase-associated domain-containing protein [Microlunatus sagamiharensis]SDU80160.1 Helicase conserved C-terminal domain-containing protein [Microlunatus sagamiharensis]
MAAPARPRTLTESLRRWPVDAVEALLRSRPDLTVPMPRDLSELASRATTSASTARALDDLDAWQRLVAEALAALPDPTTMTDLEALVRGDGTDGADAEVRATIEVLRHRALAWGDDDALHLVRTVREAFEPHPLGLAAPSRQPLADAEVEAGLAACTPAMTALLERLLWSPTGVSRQADRAGADPARSPVGALLALRLLRTLDGDTVVLPREVALRLRGGRLTPDPVPARGPELTGRSRSATLVDRAAAGAVLALLDDLDLVARALEDQPFRPLRTGGLATRDLAGLVRALGTDVGHATFLVELAAAAGLVAPGSSHGVLPTPAYDRWVPRPAAERWTVVAQAWLGATRWFARSAVNGGHALGPEAESPSAPALRRTALGLAVAAGPGTVLDPAALGDALAWERPRLARTPEAAVELSRDLWREASWLGFVALDAVSGFAPGLLAGEGLPADLAALFPDPVTHLVLQADLTAVAPGPLRHDVAADLRLLAAQESRGAGAVFRFSADSVRRAFDAGWTTEQSLEWLRAHATTPVPQPLEYLLGDVARRHGAVRVGPALSFVTSEDDAQLSVLLRHPQAAALGLRRLGAGVVIAAAEPDELLEALREVGLSPVAEDVHGRGLPAPPVPRAPAVRLAPTSAAPRTTDVASAIVAADQRAATASTAAAALDDLRAATRDGLPVRVTWVKDDGRSTSRDLAPLDLSAGLVRAVDRTNAEIVTIALSRIAAVELS